jgi:hypothetical protein
LDKVNGKSEKITSFQDFTGYSIKNARMFLVVSV